MKYDVKKGVDFKAGKKPQIIERPERLSLFLDGAGNPNDEDFKLNIQGIYSAAYFIKMAFKKEVKEGSIISEIDDYTIAPLQGLWTISKEAIERGTWTKDDLVYRLELVFPSQVPSEFIDKKLREVKEKKADIERLKNVYLGRIDCEKVCHIMHIGPYDEEEKSFNSMENFLTKEGFERRSKNHREIYIGDARRAKPDKLKTILEVAIK